MIVCVCVTHSFSLQCVIVHCFIDRHTLEVIVCPPLGGGLRRGVRQSLMPMSILREVVLHLIVDIPRSLGCTQHRDTVMTTAKVVRILNPSELSSHLESRQM